MLTAEDARKLAGMTAKEYVEDALIIIEQEAKRGNRHVSLWKDFWFKEAYDNTKKYNEAIDILRKLGYTVNFHYEEKQFVNAYTLIEW